jgi:hypothetical protein
MFARRLRVLLGFRRVLLALRVVVGAMLLSGGTMSLRGVLVMLGRFVVLVLSHFISPDARKNLRPTIGRPEDGGKRAASPNKYLQMWEQKRLRQSMINAATQSTGRTLPFMRAPLGISKSSMKNVLILLHHRGSFNWKWQAALARDRTGSDRSDKR